MMHCTYNVKFMEIIFKNVIRTSVERNLFSKININQLTPLSGMIGVCSENHTKRINKIRGQNENFMNVKAGDKFPML